MNATDTTSHHPGGIATARRRIELYETAMCCQTGVCGPRVDERLLTLRASTGAAIPAQTSTGCGCSPASC